MNKVDTDKVFVQSSQILLPTIFGDFRVSAFGFLNDKEHLILEYGNSNKLSPLVRVHSECITSEVFGSLKCDCNEQLMESIELIKREGSGIIIYLRQEGRGIGLFNKINAYKLQEYGFNTIEANHKLNYQTDLRNYELAYLILQQKQITRIRLITNNHDKIEQLKQMGLIIDEVISTKVNINPINKNYIDTKINILGHKFNFND